MPTRDRRVAREKLRDNHCAIGLDKNVDPQPFLALALDCSPLRLRWCRGFACWRCLPGLLVVVWQFAFVVFALTRWHFAIVFVLYLVFAGAGGSSRWTSPCHWWFLAVVFVLYFVHSSHCGYRTYAGSNLGRLSRRNFLGIDLASCAWISSLSLLSSIQLAWSCQLVYFSGFVWSLGQVPRFSALLGATFSQADCALICLVGVGMTILVLCIPWVHVIARRPHFCIYLLAAWRPYGPRFARYLLWTVVYLLWFAIPSAPAHACWISAWAPWASALFVSKWSCRCCCVRVAVVLLASSPCTGAHIIVKVCMLFVDDRLSMRLLF